VQEPLVQEMPLGEEAEETPMEEVAEAPGEDIEEAPREGNPKHNYSLGHLNL